jgi:DNA-binding GntR family transcriptional regulator
MRPPFNPTIPLYRQISHLVLARAQAGDFLERGLPTEKSLCAEFDVSRTTVRQALNVLKQKNLLESRRGIGTHFVGPQKQPRLSTSSGDPLHAALGSRSRIISIDKVPARADVAALFGYVEATKVCRIVRVNEVKSSPLSLVVSYLPQALAPVLTRTNLRRPLHEVIWEFCALRQKRSLHTVRVARADQMIASLLKVGLTDPVLHVQSLVFLDDNRPIRWTDNYFHEDKYEYFSELDWSDPSTPRRSARTTKPQSDRSPKRDPLKAL